MQTTFSAQQAFSPHPFAEPSIERLMLVHSTSFCCVLTLESLLACAVCHLWFILPGMFLSDISFSKLYGLPFLDPETGPRALPTLFLLFFLRLFLSDFQCTKALSFLNRSLWNFSHISMTIDNQRLWSHPTCWRYINKIIIIIIIILYRAALAEFWLKALIN